MCVEERREDSRGGGGRVRRVQRRGGDKERGRERGAERGDI